jgi:tetratricopeptide (TPR) repeat protein
MIMNLSNNAEALSCFEEARQHRLRGEVGPSMSYLENAIKHDPSFAVAHRNLGIMAHDTRQHGKAAHHLEQANILGDKPDAQVLSMLGCSQVLSGNPSKAIPVLEEALALNPDDVDARYCLVLSHIQLDNKSDAIKHFNILAPQSPHYEHALKWHFE